MQMLVSWIALHPNSNCHTNGFSLLEMLMVVFIIGLAAALVTPNLPMVFDRLASANQRDSFHRDINTLPYAAFEANQDLVLTEGRHEAREINTDEPNASALAVMNDVITPGSYRSANLKPVVLNIPEKWVVQVPKPIFYRASGFCSGGRIIVSVGTLTDELNLLPPYCQVDPETQ
jgi:prepilin-type N-terminal cleavage/methylation domain-containing protein